MRTAGTSCALCCALVMAGCATEPDLESTAQSVAVTWQNAVGVSAVGNDLTKTAAQTTWAAGASSVETITGDGFARFTTGEATTAKMIGLNVGDVNQGFTEIDFAIYLNAAGKILIYESGTNRGQVGTYAAGDTFEVRTVGGAVTYRRNDVVIYTSAVAAGTPLRVDTSLYTPGATIQDVELISLDLTWQNVVGVAAAGSSLTKTAAQDTWAAGASSVETLTGDGTLTLSTGEATTSKMVGLGVGDTTRNFVEIDYAVYLTQLGKVYIYENGVNRGLFGTYVAGDGFRIEVAGAVVTYRKNGALLYTSAVAPSFPLRVDSSLKTPGATLTNLELSSGAAVCPVYDGSGPVCTGSFTIENSADVAAIVHCVRITGTLDFPSGGPSEVTLPNLQRVDNWVFMQNFATPMTIRLPALREAGQVQVPPLTTAELPQLRSVTNSLDADVGDLSVPCLDSVGYAKAATLDAPRLRTAGQILANGTLPMLEQVSNFINGDITAPVLTLVGGAVIGPLDAPALVQAGQVYYGPGTQVPALERAGILDLEAVTASTTIDLPALEEVSGTIVRHFNASVPPLALPALQLAGSVDLLWNNQVDLPVLEQLTAPTGLGLKTRDGTFDMPALTTIAGAVDASGTVLAPALSLVTGDVLINAPQSWPALTEIQGDLTLYGSLTAGNLTDVRGLLDVNNATTASLTGLIRVGGIYAYSTNLVTLELPALTTITNTASGFAAGEVRIRYTDLTTVALPALTTIPGVLEIRANQSTVALDLASLTSVGALLAIRQNNALPNCYALEVRDQLFAAGWTGTVEIFGNFGTGGCP